MKRIAIFIDGTWNRPDADTPTNVVRLARCVHHVDPCGTPQIVIYHPGVGSGIASSLLGRFVDKLVGGALGWGTMNIIERAYRDLVFAYEPGDEVMVFGFSRGAFAARSLVGLIRNCGIPPRRHLHRIPEAIARYASSAPEHHPNSPDSHAFRAEFAPYTATSDREFSERRSAGDTNAIRFEVTYMGLWDTVSALGVPKAFPFSERINAEYQFHDTELSAMVLSARHAVSTDEHRPAYQSHRWSNIPTLSRQAHGTRGAHNAYQQLWFPGDHGSVGGGGSRQGLSSISLNWVALGSALAGLSLSWEEMDRVAHHFDIHEKLVNKFGPVRLMDQIMTLSQSDRTPGPQSIDELSLASFDRFMTDRTYRPKTLDPIYATLFNLPIAAIASIRHDMQLRDGGWTHSLDHHFRPR